MTPRPDIEIAARAAARELRHNSEPRMRTKGEGGSERERLPEPVEPGRTYRNIGIRGWLRGWVSIARGDQALSNGGRGRRRRT